MESSTVEIEKTIRYGGDGDLAGKKGENLVNVRSGKMVRRTYLDDVLCLNVRGCPGGKRNTKFAIVPYAHVFEARIPKVVVTLDEKYIRHCLNVIHLGAVKAASDDIPFRLNASLLGLLKDGLYTEYNLQNSNEGDCMGFDFTLVDQSIVGSIMKSDSIVNLMKSPLFQWFNVLDRNDDEVEASRKSPGNELTLPACSSSICSSENIESDASIPLLYDIGNGTKHTRFSSTSSTFSLSSEPSSSSSSSCCYSSTSFGTILQGMLHCTWNGGIPHFAFSLHDQRELHIADAMKVVGTSGVRPSDCTYLFYSKTHGPKELAIHHREFQLVGKMKVSRKTWLDQRNSRTVETEFVLHGCSTNHEGLGAVQVPSSTLRKSRGLSKKVVEAFRSGHFSKQRSLSRLTCGSFMSDIHSAELCLDVLDPLTNRDELLGDYLPPNLELAAIVTKHHEKDYLSVETVGWGLKFLINNDLVSEICVPSATPPSETCRLNSDSCSSNMKVIIPAGIHGGPRTPTGGPSSLFERWRSGGHCDCGGWDLGCPLRVLKTKSDKGENFPLSKEFDLYLEGSEHDLPLLRMTNVRDDLYLVHFRSSLSALQSFSIAVAHIHRHVLPLSESS